jgi:hypothetical protein
MARHAVLSFLDLVRIGKALQVMEGHFAVERIDM